MNELRALAQQAGVDLRGPFEGSDPTGKYLYAVAASGFTTGEYACRLRGRPSDQSITKKRLGY